MSCLDGCVDLLCIRLHGFESLQSMARQGLEERPGGHPQLLLLILRIPLLHLSPLVRGLLSLVLALAPSPFVDP